jgi:hypothetical protein
MPSLYLNALIGVETAAYYPSRGPEVTSGRPGGLIDRERQWNGCDRFWIRYGDGC